VGFFAICGCGVDFKVDCVKMDRVKSRQPANRNC